PLHYSTQQQPSIRTGRCKTAVGHEARRYHNFCQSSTFVAPVPYKELPKGKLNRAKFAKVVGNSVKFALYMVGQWGQNSLVTY
ncbi:MAG: hypothetical protein ACK40X_04455, partial [Armatimonadota bacterium]